MYLCGSVAWVARVGALLLLLLIGTQLGARVGAGVPTDYEWLEQLRSAPPSASPSPKPLTYGTAVATDRDGNSVVVGTHKGTAFFNTQSLRTTVGQEAFIAQYDSIGVPRWVQTLPVLGETVARGVAIDPSGNIRSVLTGKTTDGLSQSLLIKHDRNGILQWTTVVSATGGALFNAVSTDADGNAYVTGSILGDANLQNTNLSNFPRPGLLVAKYTSTGALVWVIQSEGITDMVGYGIATDTQGNTYVSGNFLGSGQLGGIALDVPDPSDWGGFIAKVDPTGHVVWAHVIGESGSAQAIGQSLALDSLSGIYVAGSAARVATENGILESVGGLDAFVTRWTPSGLIEWTRFAGSSTDDDGRAIASDNTGNCYLLGNLRGNSQIGGVNVTSLGNFTAFIASWDRTGVLQFVDTPNSAKNAVFRGLAVDASARVFITGSFAGTIDIGDLTLSSSDTVGVDGFLLKRGSRAPAINVPIASYSTVAGLPVVIITRATGKSPLQLQWLRNGTPMPGENRASLTLNSTRPFDTATYRLTASNSFGSITSPPINLTVMVTLNVSIQGAGSVTISPSGQNFLPGTPIILTPVRTSAGPFAEWSGHARGTNNPLTFIIASNTFIVANFASSKITTAVRTLAQVPGLAPDTSFGVVNANPQQDRYIPGRSIILEVVPSRWFRFDQWADGSKDQLRLIPVSAVNDYVAYVVPTTPLEFVTIGGVSRLAPKGTPAIILNGSFVTGDRYGYTGGVKVTLQSTLIAPSIFYTLDGSPPSLRSHRYKNPFTITASGTVRAIAYDGLLNASLPGDPLFLQIDSGYRLIASTDGGGKVTVSPERSYYAVNESVTLTAQALPGWSFLGWQGDASGARTPLVAGMNSDKSVTARFGTTITTTGSVGGHITIDPRLSLYPYGTTVQLTAIPDVGFKFVLWGADALGSRNSLRFTLTNSNPIISSFFTRLIPQQVAVAVSIEGNGSVEQIPLGNTFKFGQSITLHAIPERGQKFVCWNGDLSSSENPWTLTLQASERIIARFSSNPSLSLEWPFDGDSAGNNLNLVLDGTIGERYAIESWSGAGNWIPVATATNIFGRVIFPDHAIQATPQRFFRAYVAP